MSGRDRQSEEEVDRVRVTVLLFSSLRQRLGKRLLEAEVGQGSSGEALLDRLAELYPAVAEYRPVIRLAVNAAYTAGDVVLQDGDEVALITPVSGG